MATKTQLNISKKRAKILKKAKLINYDLRHNLTPAQRGVITRLWKGAKHKDTQGRKHGWGAVLTDENTIFRTVSKKRAKQLKELGYRVHGRRVYLDSEGADSVHIKRDRIIKKRGNKKTIDLLVSDMDFLDKLKQLSGRPNKKGQYLTVRIGDNGQFRKSFISFESLLNYVSKWKPKKDFDKREELINQMSIVEFTK